MKFSWSEPGYFVSAGVHAAILLATLVAFSDAGKFEDAQETIPVETISNSDFNQIMRGEKTAKEASEPKPKVDKVAEAEVQKPPPTPAAKVDVPAPPPPLKHADDPGEDTQPAAPKPPAKAAALPPPPDPVKPEPLRTEPVKPLPPAPQKSEPQAKQAPLPPPRPDAEVIETAAPQPPKKPEVVEAKAPPLPPVKPRPVEKKDDPKPKTETKLKLDQVAKLLEEKKLDDLVTAAEKPDKPVLKPPSKPKSGQEDAKPSERKFDSKAIEQLLNHDDPQATGSTGRQLNKLASLGTPTASAAKLSPAMMDQLEGLLQDQYKQCWTFLGITTQQKYMPLVQVTYNPDGSLGTEPSLVNPPTNPDLRSLADSAVRAVKTCNPLRIPTQYMPYFEQWRKSGPRVLRFDPQEMAG